MALEKYKSQIFLNCIFKWLEGLSRISKDFIPTMENGDYATVPNAVVTKYPLAIVNIKKFSGTSSVSNKTLYEYANRTRLSFTGADT